MVRSRRSMTPPEATTLLDLEASEETGGTLAVCEAALRVQEEAVALMPVLVEREREATNEARQRAAEALELAANLQSQLDELKSGERSTSRRLSLQLEASEEGAAALEAKHAESLKEARSLASDLAASRKREDESTRQLKHLEDKLGKQTRDAEAAAAKAEQDKEAAAAKAVKALDEEKRKVAAAREEADGLRAATMAKGA